MASDVKYVHHGATVVNEGQPIPPPYTAAPGQYPGYPPGPPPPTQVHVDATIIPAAVVVSAALGPHPTPMTCRSCHAQVITRTESVPSTRTHLLAALLCLLGCWLCVCIPYCSDSCQNTAHYCPNCNAYVGSYQA